MINPDRGSAPSERKLVTALFADLRGSLGMIAGRDPELADEILSNAIAVMETEVTRYGGIVAHVMGDGIMALFGAPQANEHHAARACLAALAMLRATTQSTKLSRSTECPVKLSIGINSGEAVVRPIQSGAFSTYTAQGEAVHVAARMQQIAADNTILITVDTARLVRGYFVLGPPQLRDVKGLPAPITVYEVLEETLGGFASGRSHRNLFVDRETETALLRQAHSTLANGRGRAVVIRGEAGLGKSRLVVEALLRQPGECRVALTQASPFRYRGYELAAGLVASSVGLSIADPRLIDPALLKDALHAAGAQDLVNHLLTISGFSIAEPDWIGLTPAERRERMQAAVCELFARLASQRPLLLTVEDLQWADPESLDALDRLVTRLPGLPILLIVTARPEWRCSWGPAPWLTELDLSPLPEPALCDLLAHRLTGEQAPQLCLQLAHRAAGNPFFAQMMLSGLADEGVLQSDGERFRIAAEPRIHQLPGTVRDLLSERVDRLSPSLKRILQIAAVAGRRAPFALLATVSGMQEAALLTASQQLQRAGFAEMISGDEPALSFTHDLLRETIYIGLLLRTRREIHGQVYEAILTASEGSINERAEDLAEHAYQASHWSEAVRWAVLAAQKAAERDANVTAAHFYRVAIDSVAQWPAGRDRDTTALDLYLAIRDPLFRLGRLEDMAAHFRQAEQLIEADTDWRKRGLFHAQLSHLHSLRGNSEAALAECDKALALARRHADPALAARANFQQGLELFQRWQLVAAARVLDLAWEYISQRPDDTSYGLKRGFDVAALSYATRSRAELGRFEKAAADAEMLVKLAVERKRAFDFLLCLHGHGPCSRGKGRTKTRRSVLSGSRGLLPRWRHAVARAGCVRLPGHCNGARRRCHSCNRQAGSYTQPN